MAYIRRRRKVIHEEQNNERWIISYADFITLLFAFFVVMYSMSSVNEGKYRVLSDALVTSFSNPGSSLPIFESAGSPNIQAIPIDISTKKPALESDRESSKREQEAEEILELNEISGQIEKQFYEQIENENISVKSNDDWIEVEIKSSLLFSSGSATLSKGAVPIIADLAVIIKEYNNPVEVEGFTDNIPINNDQFSSNWELSTSRSVAVLEVLIRNGMEPESLAAVGYGEFQSIADNSSPEGRQANRRVVLIISRGDHLRREMDNDTPPKTQKTNELTFEQTVDGNGIVAETINSIIQNPEQNTSPLEGNSFQSSTVKESTVQDNTSQDNSPKDKPWGIRLDDGRLLFTNDIQTSPETTRNQ